MSNKVTWSAHAHCDFAEITTRLSVDLAPVAELAAITGAVRVRRDPEDDMLLETAIAGRTESLVTGEPDLLELHPFRGLSTLTPAEFIESFD